MKKFLVLSFLFLLCQSAWAQRSGTVQGVVSDNKTRTPMAGAVIELRNDDKPDQAPKGAVTDSKGSFTISGVPYGQYSIKASFLGYTTYTDKLAVSSPSTTFNIRMEPGAVELEAVNTSAAAIRTSQKGDTVVYNAGAYKVTRDADTENLLSKMPGITVSDGQVEAQGETVKKVFVDGREFFGEDVAATIKNLPAEVIDKVEVYNRLSDQAQFTGVDDGEGYKAINIVTKRSMRTGAFGKVYAGYGYKDHYIVGGSVNFFTGKHRLSLIGLANNLNQQNFSSEDILGVMNTGGGGGGGRPRRTYGGGGGAGNFMMPPQNGISKVGSLGLNYSGQWKDKVDLTGSYFFNETNNRRRTDTWTEYFPAHDSVRYHSGLEFSRSRNFNHRFNAKLDWKIDNKNSISLRPGLSLQSNRANSSGDGRDWQVPVGDLSTERIIDIIRTAGNSKTSGYNASLSAIWMHKFDRPGRTITMDANGSQSINDPTSESYNNTIFSLPLGDSTAIRNLRNISHSKSYRLDGSVVYTEPLTSKSQLVLQYRARYSFSDADRKSYNYLSALGEFDTAFDPDVSNVYNSGYLTQRIGPGIRYGGQKTLFVGNLYYQHADLKGDQDYPVITPSRINASFDNFLYFGMMTQTFNPQNTLRVYARSSTDNPSVTQLQNFVDDRRPSRVTAGNPNLKQTTGHSISATYNRSSVKKGRSFMAMANFSLTRNNIADSTIYVGRTNYTILGNNGQRDITLQPGAQFTKPVNIADGSYLVRGGLVYGTPVGVLKSNINLSLGGQFSQSPSYIGTVDGGGVLSMDKNISRVTGLMTGATLGSNISEKLDFSLSYNYIYNLVKNRIGQGTNDNQYWQQMANFRVKWITWGDVTLTGTAHYNYFTGITNKFTEDFCLVSVFLGKKLFKSRLGELSIGVNDLLNQNKNFSRNVSTQSISNVTNNIISRYYSIQFVYNIRSFRGGQAPAQNRSVLGDEFERGGGPSFGPPTGPGGPGMGPGGPRR
ncbi:collagen-binding protein [Bacteroidia bacterium]|nr:collagen-binding protein [Bacteroidia bacterium]